MKNKSIWISDSVKNNKLNKLDRDIDCDILIMGGGIAGLSTGYFLRNSNYKTVLIEKNICGMGATSKNTGKLTWMQGLVYEKIEKNYDGDKARLYYQSQVDAIKLVREIILNNKIKCHFTRTKAYVISNDIDKVSREVNFYKDNGIKYNISSRMPFNYKDRYKYILDTNNSYVFNPYEYLVGIKNSIKDKIDIYEDTRGISFIKNDNGYIVDTENGFKIRCKYLVMATHYPINIIPFFIPFKSMVEKFFLGVAECDKGYDKQLISDDKKSVSMRYYSDGDKNYLIYGTRSHSVCTKLDVRDDYRELDREYYDNFGKKIEYFYHTHDLMTYDNIPFIGEIDDNLLIATGFNKWGNTNGTLAGFIISDIINGKKNKYIDLFKVRRGISLDKIKNLFIYNIMVGSRYIINKLVFNKGYYQDDVKVCVIDGKRCGVYIDKSGNKHIVSNVCPHMKCNLVFNYIDKTWDCPCHASRFDIDGNVIYGPSVYDIKINK